MEPRVALAVAGAVCVLVAAGRARQRGKVLVRLVLAGLAAGVVLSALQGMQLERQMSIARESGARTWCGAVVADPLPGAFGYRVTVRVDGGPLDGALVRVGWPQDGRVPELGQRVHFSAILKPVPTEEPWGRRAARAGVCASGNAWKASVVGWPTGWAGHLYRWRSTTLLRIHDIPGPGAALAEGIVLGDRRRLLGTPTEQDFQVLGLTHLVAVSGSHLALACGAVAFLGMWLRLPKKALVIATLSAGAAYAVVTGMPYSALRSLLMLGVGCAAQLLGRKGQGIASLAVATVAVIVLEPWSVFDIGLQLSVLAVGALLVFGELAAAWVGAAFTLRFSRFTEPLALTLAAQAATVPVVASAFGLFSVLAPVANAVAGPLVSLALLLGLGGAVLGIVAPEAGMLALRLACTVLSATSWLADVLASLPGAAVAFEGGWIVSTLVALAGLSAWLRWPLPRSAASGRRFVATVVCGSIALSLGPAPPQRTTVTVLDVGQGDAILVQDGGRSMLVDTGPDPATLRRALSATGVRRLDVVVLTHAHDDHTGGMTALEAVAELGWVGVPEIVPGEPLASGFNIPRESQLEVRHLAAGDHWQLGRTDVQVMWPDGDARDELGTNDTSVVLLLDCGEFEMVLTGDAESHVQEQLLAAHALREVEVLKVPHHGSTNGLTSDALSAWSPQLACISVGTGNDFGHPSGATLAMLKEAGARISRTDIGGTITIDVGDDGYRVSTGSVLARLRRTDGAVIALRERMDTVCEGARSGRAFCEAKGPSGSQDRGAQARLPYLRRRGVAARARPPPPERPHSGRGRSRLQLRGLSG